MTQQEAERFLEIMAEGMGLDTQIHRWEIYLHTNSLRYRAVETVPNKGEEDNPKFYILVERETEESWEVIGIIQSFLPVVYPSHI